VQQQRLRAAPETESGRHTRQLTSWRVTGAALCNPPKRTGSNTPAMNLQISPHVTAMAVAAPVVESRGRGLRGSAARRCCWFEEAARFAEEAAKNLVVQGGGHCCWNNGRVKVPQLDSR